MTKIQFESIKADLRKFITQQDLVQKADELMTMKLYVSDIYSNELCFLSELNAQKYKIFGDLYDKYRFNFNRDLTTRAEVETYIHADAQWIVFQETYALQDSIVAYFEDMRKSLNTMTYDIKNIIALKQMGVA